MLSSVAYSSPLSEVFLALQYEPTVHALSCIPSVADHGAAHRALQNPGLFTSEHYKQAALAVLAGIAIRLIIAIPVGATRVVPRMRLPLLSYLADED